MPDSPSAGESDGRLHAVVVGIRDPRGRWLMVRRSAQVIAPLKVCFPGGGIEPGESQEQAIIREMREELGIDVRPLRFVWKWEYQDRPVTLWGWTAELLSPIEAVQPHEPEIAEVLWMTPEEGSRHTDGLATNCVFIEALMKGCDD